MKWALESVFHGFESLESELHVENIIFSSFLRSSATSKILLFSLFLRYFYVKTTFKRIETRVIEVKRAVESVFRAFKSLGPELQVENIIFSSFYGHVRLQKKSWFKPRFSKK